MSEPGRIVVAGRRMLGEGPAAPGVHGMTERQAEIVTTFLQLRDLKATAKVLGMAAHNLQRELRRPHVLRALFDVGLLEMFELWLAGTKEMRRILADPEASDAAKVAIFKHVDEKVSGKAAEMLTPIGDELSVQERMQRLAETMPALGGLLRRHLSKPEGDRS